MIVTGDSGRNLLGGLFEQRGRRRIFFGFLRKQRELRTEIEQVKQAVEQAERAYDLNKAAELKYGRLTMLEKQLEVAKHETTLLKEEVTEEDIARFKTRLEHIDEPCLRRLVNSDITRLKARKAAQVRDIAKRLRAYSDLARRLDLVLSIPGIGERTALALLIRMPELGQISREEAAALAGLAPFDDDSGQHRGQRHIAGGRSRLRRSLFAAALPAAYRWNKALIALYARLKARGKAHNSALVACARKLLIYANTVVQRGTPWTEKAA